MNGVGSGSLLTRKVLEATFTGRPSMLAVILTTASSPTRSGRAIQESPLRTSDPLVMVADISFIATPGTEMLTGLSIPAYSTFIIVAETVAIGSMTV